MILKIDIYILAIRCWISGSSWEDSIIYAELVIMHGWK